MKGACNKYGKKIAPWSTTVGDGIKFVRATSMAKKLHLGAPLLVMASSL
jgi:hypothetical protein